MAATEKPSLNEEAATWLVALDGGTADLAAFNAWRASDPRRAAAFAQVAATWEKLGDARPLAAAAAPHRTVMRGEARPSRRSFVQAAAIAAAAGIGLVGTRLWARSSATTGVGERRTILLEGGTRLDLNTDSAVEWTNNARPQRIWLSRGEIALDIPPAEGAILTATRLDTTLVAGRYNARVQNGTSTMLVLAGELSSDQLPQRVHAGQQVTTGRNGHDAVLIDAGANARERAAGWRRGEIVLAGEPLTAVITEYNRYLTRKIAIGDPRLRSIRMGGRFTSNDPADFLAALHASFGIVARQEARQTVLFPQPPKNFPA